MPLTYDIAATLLKDRGLADTVQYLNSAGKPADVARTYHELILEAYWKRKDLPFVVGIAPAGIIFCITQSSSVSTPAVRDDFLGSAKKLAYDLGSFTWPGWNEPGIFPSPNDIDIGRGAALLNLELAVKLNRPADRLRDAHWLLGAHLLWANDIPAAIAEFQEAIPLDAPLLDPKRLLMEGYLLLARLLAKEAHALEQWQALLATLQSQGTSEAQFSLNQLKTAHDVFQARR